MVVMTEGMLQTSATVVANNYGDDMVWPSFSQISIYGLNLGSSATIRTKGKSSRESNPN